MTLGQGSRIRARNGEGRAGSRCGVPKTETKVCGGTGYAVDVFITSLGHGDAWIGVLGVTRGVIVLFPIRSPS